MQETERAAITPQRVDAAELCGADADAGPGAQVLHAPRSQSPARQLRTPAEQNDALRCPGRTKNAVRLRLRRRLLLRLLPLRLLPLLLLLLRWLRLLHARRC